MRVRVQAQKMVCGCVRCTLKFLCDVRAGADQNCRTKGLKNKNASSESSSPHCICHSDFFKTSFCTANTATLSVHPYCKCKPTQNKEGTFLVKNMKRLQFCPILFAYLTLVKCIAQDQQSSKYRDGGIGEQGGACSPPPDFG